MTFNWKITLLSCCSLFYLSCANAGQEHATAKSQPAELSATDTNLAKAPKPADTAVVPTATEPKTKNLVGKTTKKHKPATAPVTKTQQRIVARPAAVAETTPPASKVTPRAQPPTHRAWDELLQKHVNPAGQVDYKGFQRDQKQLDDYLKSLAKQLPDEDWGRDARLAYWINAYNAYTVKLILGHYPVKSIREIYDGNPWDVKWIELEEGQFSLNQIEHRIIRKRFDEPRIHFAVNCAAQSCPPLLPRAFTAENLDSMLAKATRAFVNNPSYNKISTNNLKLSKIFDWYAEDFENIQRFIGQYSNTAVDANASVSYMDYDWSLNAQ
ncbi:MAG: DUF547 domain-containing protein [Bacteroidetes bacterium]|jgi:hypothetical protein|nr:DUF547 domain-containing protein [Bacteroidota bacterium]